MFAPSFYLLRARYWPRLSVRGVLDSLVARDAVYRQRLMLATLDDRMLRDMGLTRADVDKELRRTTPW